MLPVSQEVKTAYSTDSCSKSLIVKFPELNLTFSNDDISGEEFTLKESLLENDSLEFIGCIANHISIKLYGLKQDVKGKLIQVFIKDDITKFEMPLFTGYAESVKKESYKGMKTIEAYDRLQSLGNVDVTDWYNNHSATTIQRLLLELSQRIGLSLSTKIELPNGSKPAFCGTSKKVSQLSVLKLLKYICQINGGFGRIDRDGKFDIVFLQDELAVKRYPSVNLFPWHDRNLYPNQPGTILPNPRPDYTFSYYRKCEFEEFNVKPINKVLIRDNDTSEGVSYGTGSNKYIIQGNIFAYGQDKKTLQDIGRKIYERTNGISFTPFNASNYALPFVECGDNIYYTDLEDEQEIRRLFIVFNRTIKGIQAMTDSYSADGTENQSEFITDLGSQVESIRDEQRSQEKEKTDDLEELKKRVARLEAIIASSKTLTGYMIDSPVVESVETEIIAETIAGLDED